MSIMRCCNLRPGIILWFIVDATDSRRVYLNTFKCLINITSTFSLLAFQFKTLFLRIYSIVRCFILDLMLLFYQHKCRRVVLLLFETASFNHARLCLTIISLSVFKKKKINNKQKSLYQFLKWRASNSVNTFNQWSKAKINK